MPSVVKPRLSKKTVARKRVTAAEPAVTVKSLGRRPGKVDTREIILNAAEGVFAELGFAGASMREIAKRADVNQALLHHYFGNKENLFKDVFLRRGQELANRRIELLEELESRKRAPRTEEIVHAFLSPAYELKRQEGTGGVSFLQLQARMHNELRSVTLDLRVAAYDQAMLRYIKAFSKALPALDAETIYWRMTFAVGAYLYTISDLHHLELLSKGKCDPKDLDSSLEQLTDFIVGGFSKK